MPRKQEEEDVAWEKIMALPDDRWRVMVVKLLMRARGVEDRRRKSDLPRLLSLEREVAALKALTQQQTAQIVDLQVMLSNVIAAMAPMATTTPQVFAPISELKCLSTEEVSALLDHWAAQL